MNIDENGGAGDLGAASSYLEAGVESGMTDIEKLIDLYHMTTTSISSPWIGSGRKASTTNDWISQNSPRFQ